MTPGHLIILNRRKTKKNRIISSIWPWTKCTKCMCSKMCEPFFEKFYFDFEYRIRTRTKEDEDGAGVLGFISKAGNLIFI